MRNRFIYTLKNKDTFAKNLIFWAKKYKHSCFLDSNKQSEKMPRNYANYDFLFGVGATKVCSPKKDSFDSLKIFYEQNKDWMFGCFSYDLKNETGELTSENIDNLHFPNLFFFIPKIVFSFKEDTLFIDTFLAKKDTDKLVEEIKCIENHEGFFGNLKLQKRETKQEYLEKIKQIKAHIKRGDIYEMNYCQEFFSENAELNAEALFCKLNKKTKAPFSAFLHLDDKYLVCSSPERFLRKQSQHILSQPIKGTRKRSENKEVDSQLKKELLNSEKDKSENVMITDLVRNDLSKYARKASVKVEELFGVYSFEQVHQMITSISAELSSDSHFLDVIEGAFPMGSMTGAPKRKAMELIEKFECTKRGLFSGSVGYISPNGDFDFNVVIRSIVYNVTNKYFSVMVGGAITDKSVAEQEYDECLIKVKAILEIVTGEKVNS
ncbi:MAG: anthranilate synthase component I family protein [Flavobacteriales bacterium]|nr:anthranilate synthase component I family protein [Flavobacteriales bacterium]